VAKARRRKVSTRKKTAARSRGKRRARGRVALSSRLRTLGAVLVAAGFAAGFATAVYVVRLDRIVVARFAGPHFRVPSRVFSAPTILYPGLNYELIDLRGTFERLGYREAEETRDLPPGRFVWGRGRVRVHLRAFEPPSRPEPPRDVVLRLSGKTIEEIRELPRGRELGAVLLEPEQIGAYYGPEREQRDLVTLDEVPDHLVDAILAVEDQRFETHVGVDVKRIAGALLANLRAGSIRQGGSTLTQQLVKNFFLTPERTIKRKVQEAVMALLVELRYDKRAILTAYLNEIYLGQRGSTAIHGVGEAARLYFGKKASDLSVAESALLAAIIQSPNSLSPYRDPERATLQGRPDGWALGRVRARPVPGSADRLRLAQGSRRDHGFGWPDRHGRGHLHGGHRPLLHRVPDGRVLREVRPLPDRHPADVRHPPADHRGRR